VTAAREGSAAGELGRIVVGLFSDRSRAEQAITALRYAGFGDDQVHMATRDGGALVTVEGNQRLDTAQAILEQHGADLGPVEMAEQAAEAYGGGNRRSDEDPGYPGPERRLADD
jgi:hypothetical protein